MAKEERVYKVLVCMPYTPQWAQPVWDALSTELTKQDTRKVIHVYRVDTSQFPADVLAERIEAEVSRADVIVFDLTEANPNVHIEIGLALAQVKPLILMTQDRRWVATHLQGRIVEEYSPANVNRMKRFAAELLMRIREKIEVVDAERKREEAEIRLSPIYQAECYSYRTLVGLERYFREASKRIDILTTNLQFLFEEYDPDEAPGRTYFDEIQASLDRDGSKVKVRILTLDPESDFAAKRGKQLGFAPAILRDALRSALSHTVDIAKNYATDRFEVRTYDEFPNQITFRTDNWVFACVVAQPTQSRNHLTFKLDRRQAGVDNSFINHFLNVWGKSSSV